MRKALYIILIAAAAFVSCEKIGTFETPKEGIVITLSPAGVTTKATAAGVTSLKENYVGTINYFIYDSSTDELLYKSSKTISESIEAPKEYSLNVSNEDFATIFENRTSVTFYVLANVASKDIGENTSKDELEAIALEIQNSGLTQTTFAMTGLGTLTKTESSDVDYATGTIALERLVSKLTVNLKVTPSFAETSGSDSGSSTGGNEGTGDDDLDDDGSATWTPVCNQMTVVLHNGAKSGTVSGLPDSEPTLFNSATWTPDSEWTSASPKTDGYYQFSGALNPFYTYPREWQMSDSVNDELPFVLIMLPWQKTSDSTTERKNTWYKIVFGYDSFAANSWYNVTISLSGLGSLTSDEPVEVNDVTFDVAPWAESLTGAFNTIAEIEDIEARVLEVGQKTVVLYNEDSAEIGYTTSHECEISQIVVTTMSVAEAGGATTSSTTITDATEISELITVNSDAIVFTHALNNDFTSSSYDITPYTYTITVRHKDSTVTTDTFTITQYPAIMVETERNSGAGKESTEVGWNGYCFVNGVGQGTSNSWNYYGTGNWQYPYDVANWGFGEDDWQTNANRNHNMYIITVSILPEGKDYAIGDPRELAVNNLSPSGTNGDSWATGASVQGTSRVLTWYHPTRTDSSVENMISPKFRIASSHGAHSAMTKDYATKRCASYQEDGYPAGRWRVPTKAEIKFVIGLSVDGKIPTLFSNNNTNYWSSTGALNVSSTNTVTESTATTGSVRCVYDDWVWEESDYPRLSDEDKTTFTWGDME